MRTIAEFVSRAQQHTQLGGKVFLLLFVVGLLLGLAAAAVELSFLLIAVGGLLVCTIGLMAIISKGYRVFWTYLIFLLFGYQFLGKGFAYVGVYPVLVAEIGLGLAGISALLILLLNRLKRPSYCLRPAMTLLLIFITWQALRTIPYLTTYSLDAARDAVLWIYAAYVFFICLLIPRQAVSRFFVLYGRLLPYYLIWLIIVFPLVKLHPLNIRFPGAPVSLIWLKSGDVGVHLAGIGAFMLLRLDARGRSWSKLMLWFLWLLWGTVWVAYGATNRAGMLSALVGVGVVLLWRPKTRWDRPLILAVLMLLLLLVTNFSLEIPVGRLPDSKQAVSFQQIVSNFVSSLGRSSGALEATKQWRLNWWRTILDYTFGGEYFWAGKGYGINLADDDGFQVRQDHSLRSPHNVFMTILARSGVPGLLLWILFLLGFGWMLIKRLLTRKQRVGPWDARYALWILAYWLAFLSNASFDVFLEGPMGGVWFWSLIGMSLVYFGGRNHVQQVTAASQNLELLVSQGSTPVRCFHF